MAFFVFERSGFENLVIHFYRLFVEFGNARQFYLGVVGGEVERGSEGGCFGEQVQFVDVVCAEVEF